MEEFNVSKEKASNAIQDMIIKASASASSQKIAYLKKFYSEQFANFYKTVEREIIKQEETEGSLF